MTALSALIWPAPYHELWPVPPWHSCGSSFGRVMAEYGVFCSDEPGAPFRGSSVGHACGSAVCCMCASTCPGRIFPFCGLFRLP